MNWLAHTFLSKPEIEFRLGNLLADCVKGSDRAEMTPRFLDGVRQHRSIDAFTDYHPVVHSSRARLMAKFPRVTGIIVDIFYDHLLARNWECYSQESLASFTTRIYDDMRTHPCRLPPQAQDVVEYIVTEDRFTSYRSLQGIRSALHGVSRRLEARTGKDFQLEESVPELTAQFDALESDFHEFFPLLQHHVEVNS